MALATVPQTKTGANAQRLIFSTLSLDIDKALVRMVVLLVILIHPSTSFSLQELKILSWNIESNRPGSPPVSDPATIGRELIAMLELPATRAPLVALCEVEPKTVANLRDAVSQGLHAEVDLVTSGSGGFMDSDSLLFIVDKTRFAIIETIEIHRYAGLVGNFVVTEGNEADSGALRARSPLAVLLEDQTSHIRFWVIVNHLARGEAELRTDQARMLKAWAQDHREPILAVGDFNFDYDFHTQRGNPGFDAMLDGNVWQWLKPNQMIDTNWSDDPKAKDQRVDRYPDSMLDFVFVANEARDWNGKVEIIVRPGDFPDSDKTSDHRPVLTTLQLKPATPSTGS